MSVMDSIEDRYQVEIEKLKAEIDRLTAELTDLKAEQKKDFEEAISIIHDQGAVNINLKEDNVILTAERDGFRNGQAQVQNICDGLQDSIKKYAAERLADKEEIRRLKVEMQRREDYIEDYIEGCMV